MGASRGFYEAAFGWAFIDYGPDDSGIRSPDGDGEVGGLGVGRPSGSGGVMVLLCSEDLTASVTAVEAAGGTIVEAPYDFPGGSRFLFTDHDGNRLGVWTSTRS